MFVLRLTSVKAARKLAQFVLYRPHRNHLFIPPALTLGRPPPCPQVRFFDMITIAVPPALPACLTIATVFSIGRLRKKGVYVTSPDRITLAGQLDVICFDKTGRPAAQPPAPISLLPRAFTILQPPTACIRGKPRNVRMEARYRAAADDN